MRYSHVINFMRKPFSATMKGIFFGLGMAFCLAAFFPSLAGAQPQSTCDYCDDSWGWASCVLGGGGVYQHCFQTNPGYCSTYGYCWLPWQQAVDLTGTAVGPNTEDKAILTAATLTRPCDSAITARVLSKAEAMQHRRKIRTVVIRPFLNPSSVRSSDGPFASAELESRQ